MATSLECLGLAEPGADDLVALQSALERLPRRLMTVARTPDVELLRHDDRSGVRITLTQDHDRDILDVVPSFAAPAGATFHSARVAGEDLVAAAVHDDLGGEYADEDDIEIPVVAQLVQARLLTGEVCGPAAVTAFAHEVEVHPDRAAYVASLDGGIPWGAESFVPLGLFGEGPLSAFGRLSGTVLTSDTRTNRVTGLPFHRARARTAGFEAEVLISPADHAAAPPAGAVVAGTVYLVAEMEQLMRRVWRWSRRHP